MARIGLISCVSLKRSVETSASDLYISPLFKKAKSFAQDRCDSYYILSAKHGLLSPTDSVEPYDLTLKTFSKAEQIKWANMVYAQLLVKTSESDELVFLAGESYRQHLEEKLIQRGNHVAHPLLKMSIGEQLQWYTGYAVNKDRVSDLDNFYGLIGELANGLDGGVKLKDLDGKLRCPPKGVYFFFEHNEIRKTDPFLERIVRVGTHGVSKGSSSTLWNRLRTHRGGSDLNGNHRGSIFRLHVGKSLISRDGLNFPTWGIGQNATPQTKVAERDLECAVSGIIGNMRVIWLSITDEAGAQSDRSFIERNSIALLSNFHNKIDTASKNWLGGYNPHPAILTSGLWNVNYIEEDYDPRFLEIFSRFVRITLGKEPGTCESIVPTDWLLNRIKKKRQLDLFNNENRLDQD